MRIFRIESEAVDLFLSELVLLQELEEVLNFDAAIFWHVCAVNGVSDSIKSELSPIVKKDVMSVTVES